MCVCTCAGFLSPSPSVFESLRVETRIKWSHKRCCSDKLGTSCLASLCRLLAPAATVSCLFLTITLPPLSLAIAGTCPKSKSSFPDSTFLQKKRNTCTHTPHLPFPPIRAAWHYRCRQLLATSFHYISTVFALFAFLGKQCFQSGNTLQSNQACVFLFLFKFSFFLPSQWSQLDCVFVEFTLSFLCNFSQFSFPCPFSAFFVDCSPFVVLAIATFAL